MMEFDSAHALREHYKAIHARFYPITLPRFLPERPEPVVAAPPAEPPPKPEPPAKPAWFTPTLVEVQVAQSDVTMRAVCLACNIPMRELLGQRRTKPMVRPRHIVCYLLKKAGRLSYPAIGRKLGGRDHTTVLHGARNIERDRKVDPELDALVTKLEQELGL